MFNFKNTSVSMLIFKYDHLSGEQHVPHNRRQNQPYLKTHSGIIAATKVTFITSSSFIIVYNVFIIWVLLIWIICGKIIGLCRLFCSCAFARVVFLGEVQILWMLVPHASRRLQFSMMLVTIDLSASIHIRKTMGSLIGVCLIAL